MKIRTLILMAIVVILAGCSGSILQKNTEINFPSNFANTSWSGDGYSATFSSTGYTIVVENEGRITNTSRYGVPISPSIDCPDENTVEVSFYLNYPSGSKTYTDTFRIEGNTLTIHMENVYLDGSGEIWEEVFNVNLSKN